MRQNEKYIMDAFTQFLAERGIEDPSNLILFLNEFAEHPELFFTLSDEDRARIEGQMDQVLGIIEKKWVPLNLDYVDKKELFPWED